MASAFVFVLSYIVIQNTILEKRIEEKKVESLSNWLTFQGMASSYKLANLSVIRYNKNYSDTIPIIHLAAEGARIGIYINRNQCISCWEKIVNKIRNITDTIKNIQQPFILAEGYNSRDIRVIERDDSLKVPIFAVVMKMKENQILSYLATSNRTFIFQLQPDGRITNIIFYDDIIAPFLGRFLEKIMQNELMLNQNDGKNAEGFKILNPIIKLGDVLTRRKYEIVYYVQNNNQHTCTISGIATQCNCIIEKKYPKSIKPREIDQIKLTYISNGFGKFSKEAKVQTNLRKEPYILKFEGNIQ